jgi:hypothetical protein
MPRILPPPRDPGRTIDADRVQRVDMTTVQHIRFACDIIRAELKADVTIAYERFWSGRTKRVTFGDVESDFASCSIRIEQRHQR